MFACPSVHVDDGAVLPPCVDMVNWHLQPVKALVLKPLVPVSHQQFLNILKYPGCVDGMWCCDLHGPDPLEQSYFSML